MEVPIWVLVTSTTGTSLVTVIDSETDAEASAKLTDGVEPMSSRTSLTSLSTNPWRVALRV